MLGAWGVPAALLGVIVLLLAIPKIIDGVRAASRVLTLPLRYLSPGLYTASARRDLARRRRIAATLVDNLDLAEESIGWQAGHYTEIHASIESTDRPQRVRGLFPLRRGTATYRTKALGAAFARERVPIVHLRGPAGSGKSVTLRRYARDVLTRSRTSKVRQLPLALYISLRDFDREPAEATVANLTDYIGTQLNPRGTVELADYLRDGLAADIRDGHVIVLFDSFDEIPAVLSSASIDRAVRPYVDLINSFIGGGKGRCIVASREYHGPRVPSWARLELVALAYSEQVELLAAYGLSQRQIAAVDHLLSEPGAGFTTHLRNPMYLSLLARYVISRDSVPTRPGKLFEDFLLTSLRDAETFDQESTTTTLVEVLQHLAASLTRRDDAGLLIPESIVRREINRHAQSQDAADDMLATLAASRILVPVIRGRRERSSAFAHRLVREYLASEYVIAHPDEVHPHELAVEPRWRETAVALLQVGVAANTDPLLAEVSALLADEARAAAELDESGEFFEWSPRAAHLLEMLITAHGSDPSALPTDVRRMVGAMIAIAWRRGGISERKFALDCAPLAPEEERAEYVRQAFAGSSIWLRLTALRRCALLSPLPESIEDLIRRLLVTLLSGAQLRSDGKMLDGDLRRLYEGGRLVRARKLLTWVPYVVFGLCCAKVASNFLIYQYGPLDVIEWRYELMTWLVPPVALFWLFQSSQPMAFRAHTRMARLAHRMAFWFDDVDEDDPDGTEILWLVLCVLYLWFAGLYLVLDVLDAVLTGDALYDVGQLALHLVSTLYVLIWGPAMLRRVRFGRLRTSTSVRSVVFAPVAELARMGGALVESVGTWLPAILKTVFTQIVVAAAIFGVFFLLDQFGGTAGQWAHVGLEILLLAILPVVVLVAIAAEVRSRWRVRSSLRRTRSIDQGVLINEMIGFADPTEAYEYLRALRFNRTNDLRAVRPELVRDLIRLIERSPQAEEATLALVVSSAASSNGDATVIRIETRTLRSWHGEVLDELGRLQELLNER
ncbi:NACHT domain-containing protein [Kutzneria sp. NPDC052558]|uniref:NACHT domain-containing protein n=1 Tax=Kutzneria sp. NPDC052558 TaxID=3364121 RepID=UPI0037C5DBA5